MTSTESFNLVFFGGTGDLVMRKLLPAMYQCHRAEQLSAAGRILCLGRRNLTQAEYIGQVTAKAQEFVPADEWDETVWQAFSQRLEYVRVDAEQAADYANLRAAIDAKPASVNVIYLSTSPELFAGICENLAAIGLNDPQSRVVLEKPLGHDLASSNEINAVVGKVYSEKQIFRIDHYLGKESVQNLMALRFSNGIFEPLWRREWIRDVQITIAEEVGIGSRGGFYDGAGALRDMLQNHLLQLLCFVAMEPPFSLDPDAIRDEKLKVLRSMVPLTPQTVRSNTVRGQYRAGTVDGKPVVGYLDESGVPADSRTETYMAVRAEIKNWRWEGVPFFLRTGKRLPDRLAEIVINFRDVPHMIFPTPAKGTGPNRLVIRLQPDEYIKLHMLAKAPGDSMKLQEVSLDLDFDASFSMRRAEAYERLLLDAIRGNLSLFVRQDELQQAWHWVEPILETWAQDTTGPEPYAAGTWGPAVAANLLRREGLSWQEDV